MKYFNCLDYNRPSYSKIKQQINSLTNILNKSKNYEEYISYIRKIIDIQNYIEELHD